MLRSLLRLTSLSMIITVIVVFSARGIGVETGRSVLIWQERPRPFSITVITGFWDDGREFRFDETMHIEDFRWSPDGRWAWFSNFNRVNTVHVWDSWRLITVSQPNTFNSNLEWGVDGRLLWDSRENDQSPYHIMTWDGIQTRIDDTAVRQQPFGSHLRLVSFDGRTVWITRAGREHLLINLTEDGSNVRYIKAMMHLIDLAWSPR